MRIKNTPDTYGTLSIAIHWLFALAVFGLFGLGLYMVELTYYDPWYHGSLEWHKSIGILLFILLLFRICWRLINIQPTPEPSKPWEHSIAALVHSLLYLVPLLLMVSGYLISTADGRSVAVFELFEIQAIPTMMKNQEDFFGDVHAILAWGLIVLSSLHVAAALKHHFITKNRTLKRMLKVY